MSSIITVKPKTSSSVNFKIMLLRFNPPTHLNLWELGSHLLLLSKMSSSARSPIFQPRTPLFPSFPHFRTHSTPTRRAALCWASLDGRTYTAYGQVDPSHLRLEVLLSNSPSSSASYFERYWKVSLPFVLSHHLLCHSYKVPSLLLILLSLTSKQTSLSALRSSLLSTNRSNVSSVRSSWPPREKWCCNPW